jgi:hypothetical protein
MEWGNEDVALNILYLSTKWRRVVRFALLLLYFQQNSPPDTYCIRGRMVSRRVVDPVEKGDLLALSVTAILLPPNPRYRLSYSGSQV